MKDINYPKPHILKFVTIREKVEELRKEYIEDETEIPVNIEDLIERKLKLEIRPELNLIDKAATESFLSIDQKTIFIDNARYMSEAFEKRTRFTLAHELGHFVLHKHIYQKISFSSYEEWSNFILNYDKDDLDWFELQAHEFAGRLLVPRDHLLKEIEKLKDQINNYIQKLQSNLQNDNDPNSIEEYIKEAIGRKLSDKYMVSNTVIQVRLKRENIFQELEINFK